MLFRLGGEKEFRALRVRFTLGIAFIRFRFKLIVFSLFRLLLFRLFRVVNVQILNLSVLQSEPQNVQRESLRIRTESAGFSLLRTASAIDAIHT